MKNFWKTSSKPILILAPMEEVTDFAFREIVSTLPRPDVFFTEFTSAEGLCSPGKKVVSRKLKYSENQRPVVAQLWGTNPKSFFESAKIVKRLKFDGIDINMGCPDKAVTKKGAGSALINNHELAQEIIRAAKEGSGKLPLSVKTRLGYDENSTDSWFSFLLSQNLDALTIHGRTSSQKSKGEASWDEIGKAVMLKNKINPETTTIGNGDIKSFATALEMHKKYGVDGVMIGRGIFSNPWVFEKVIEAKNHSREEYLKLLSNHMQIFEQTWQDSKNFSILKKFFKMYLNNFPGDNKLRLELMKATNRKDVEKLLSNK